MEEAPANQPEPKPTRMSKAPWIGVALIVLLLFGAVAWRRFDHARKLSWMKACQENLIKIEGAKEQWALENNKTLGDIVPNSTDSDVWGREQSFPTCPSGRGEYLINPVGIDPECPSGLLGHLFSEVGDAITELE